MIKFVDILIEFFPDSFQSEKNQSGDLQKLLNVFGKEFDLILNKISSVHNDLHPLLTDVENLEIISKNVNRSIDSRLPEDANRRTLFTAVETYKIKGTGVSLDNLLFDLGIIGEPKQLYTNDYDPLNFVEFDDIPSGSTDYYKSSFFKIDITPSANVANTEQGILIFLDKVNEIIPINVSVSLNVLAGGGTEPMYYQMIANFRPIICSSYELIGTSGNQAFILEDN